VTTSSLAVGTHAIVATYSGDVNDAASQSSTLSQVVGTIPTVTNLGITTTTGANPQIVLVATVLNNPSVATVGSLPLPTGTVTFSYGSTVIGSAQIDANGVATLIPNLNSGSYSFIASYGGDTDHAPSSSTATLFSTTPLGFNLTVTPNPVNIPDTENTTVTVTLASANGFTDTIGLGCASLPSGVICHFAVSDPTLAADGTQTVQLTIDTNNPLGGGATAMNGPPGSSSGASKGEIGRSSPCCWCFCWAAARCWFQAAPAFRSQARSPEPM